MPFECRCCLTISSDPENEYIHLASFVSNDKTYLDCFNTCTQLNADLDDDFPSFICSNCSQNLLEAYEFVRCSIEADEILKSRLKTAKSKDSGSMETVVIEPLHDGVLEESMFEERLDDITDLESNCYSVTETEGAEIDEQPIQFLDLEEKCKKTVFNGKEVIEEADLEDNKVVNGIEKQHPRQEHKFLCVYCPRYFKNQKSLKQHERIHTEETDDILYFCTECNRHYSTATLFEQHRKNVHGERDYSCTICGNAFKLKSQLTEHLKLHLKKDIKCPHCDKKYARQFDLNVHLRTHSGAKPFACHLCDKRFAIKVRLTYHLQKHYGVKHTCKECGAVFNARQNLKAHTFKHTGMPYRCELCDDHGFPYRDVFRRHLLRVHNATISEEALVEMFQNNTGKTTRIKEVRDKNLLKNF